MNIFLLILVRYLNYKKYNFLYMGCAIIMQVLILGLFYLLDMKIFLISSMIRYTDGTMIRVMRVANTMP